MEDQPRTGKSAVIVSIIGAIATISGIFLTDILDRDPSTEGLTARDIIEGKDCYLVSLPSDCVVFRNRKLSNAELDAVEKGEAVAEIEETELGSLCNGDAVRHLGNSGKFVKVLAYAKNTGKYQIGYVPKKWGRERTLEKCN